MISVCIVAKDDLPFLKQCCMAAWEYADEVLVADNGSTDGSAEWLEEQRRQGSLRCFHYPGRIIEDLGFSFMKNDLASKATQQWIHSLDADECLSPEQRTLLKPFLERCRRPVVSIRTLTYRAVPHLKGLTDWTPLMSNPDHEETTHRRIYLRESGILWKGYIHEELYVGDMNAISLCQPSDFKHLHFTNYRTWGNNDEKRARYSWMLLKAYRTRALQMWTNCWWYQNYVPENLKDIEHWAAKHEETRAHA